MISFDSFADELEKIAVSDKWINRHASHGIAQRILDSQKEWDPENTKNVPELSAARKKRINHLDSRFVKNTDGSSVMFNGKRSAGIRAAPAGSVSPVNINPVKSTTARHAATRDRLYGAVENAWNSDIEDPSRQKGRVTRGNVRAVEKELDKRTLWQKLRGVPSTNGSEGVISNTFYGGQDVATRTPWIQSHPEVLNRPAPASPAVPHTPAAAVSSEVAQAAQHMPTAVGSSVAETAAHQPSFFTRHAKALGYGGLGLAAVGGAGLLYNRMRQNQVAQQAQPVQQPMMAPQPVQQPMPQPPMGFQG